MLTAFDSPETDAIETTYEMRIKLTETDSFDILLCGTTVDQLNSILVDSISNGL